MQEKAADDDDDDVVTDDCIFDRKLMENKKHKQTNKKSYEFHLLFAYFWSFFNEYSKKQRRPWSMKSSFAKQQRGEKKRVEKHLP